MNGKEVIKKLKRNGFEIKRVKGSHHFLVKNNLRCLVAVHGSKDIPIGTLKNIEKQSGVKL